MVHHRANLNSDVIPAPSRSGPPVSLRERVLTWIRDDRPPAESLDSLRTVVWHLESAWSRRREPMVTVMHYNDLSGVLDHQMRHLAARLEISVAENLWPRLVRAATFEQMRGRAAELAPNERLGLFADDRGFFRSGVADQWRLVLTDDDVIEYEQRLRSLSSPEFAWWLEHGAGQPV